MEDGLGSHRVQPRVLTVTGMSCFEGFLVGTVGNVDHKVVEGCLVRQIRDNFSTKRNDDSHG